ncbi:hypothetical protein [Candidatus Neptunichlamydia sp. REUL1]|uniref:hypothetical protein n=1 Tax=Candidatus Neptunichlamydia sp. REUL1 TaxID=3064277 RepID=UPI00292CC28A|nr:hypothetical protein [Candidatus Neptunochlamydia sp. REUL1]
MHGPVLPDVKMVNINHRESWEGAVSRHFRSQFKASSLKNLCFSIITFGVYPYKKYKQSKRSVAQALSARKLFFFKALQEHIEERRKQQTHSDPRQALNAIFMSVQSEKVDETEEALEFKAIYYPNELLLFITNPIRDNRSIRLHRHKSRKHLDYLRMWHELKKKARINQYRQIQNINYCSRMLKEEYCLAPSGIHDRLTRTSVCRKNIYLTTKFRELGKAFQEIVLAYQDFDELKETNADLFYLLETLSKTSQKDIETLQTYLASCYLPRDLPLENRKQLIQLANQQEVLYHMSDEQQFCICALILNKYQWEFLLSIQEVSQVTLSLLDWAFEECPSEIQKELSFVEQIYEGIDKKVKGDVEAFPTLNEKITEDETLGFMTIDFAKELNREWPSLYLYDHDKLLFHADKTDSFSVEKLVKTYKAMQALCPEDEKLFSLLQQAFSQVGRQAFRSAIEDGVLKLLGAKPQYFLPILSNTDITVVKEDGNYLKIRYTFEQLITKKGEVQHPFKKEKYMVITQPLIKHDGRWFSPEAQKKIAAKKRSE